MRKSLLVLGLTLFGVATALSGETSVNTGDTKEVEFDSSGSRENTEQSTENQEGSGEQSGDDDQPRENERATMKAARNFPGFPYPVFRGPMKIVPLEPSINKQKPTNRKCFFCFPRGGVGRVEMTGAGGPFLLNGFGGMPGMGRFGMGYPGMGFPGMGMIYPQGGCPGGCGPGFGCCGGGRPYPFPIIFQGFKEKSNKGAGKSSDKKANDSAKASDKPSSKLEAKPRKN